MSLRYKFGLLTATAILVGLTALPASASAAASLNAFSVRPVEFNPADPATRAYFKVTASPSTTFARKVLISNTGNSVLNLLVYPVDGLTGVTSGGVYGNHQDVLHKAGLWLTPGVSSVTVAPRGHQVVSFSVTVPHTANPGDHLAGIALEDRNPTTTTGRFSIKEIFRIVVGVEIRVPGPAAAQLQIRTASLKALPGTNRASIVIGLANAGTLLCKPALTVALQGAGVARSFTRQLDTVLPGDSIPYPFAWPASLTAGSYKVHISGAHCGRAATLATTVSNKSPLNGDTGKSAPWQAAEVKTKTISSWWLLVLAGVGGLAAGAVLASPLLAMRRRVRSHGQIMLRPPAAG